MLLVYLGIIFVNFGFISCSDDSESPLLTVNVTESTIFEANGGGAWIDVASNVEWNAFVRYDDESSKWLSLSTTSGKGDNKIKVMASANNSTDTRNAKVIIQAKNEADLIQELTLSQKGEAAALKLSPNNITLLALDKAFSIRIESNTEWEITTDASWLKLQKERGSRSGGVEMKADDNTGRERTATVTVSANKFDLKKSVQVTQQGIESYLFREPYTGWETSIDEMKAYMNTYEIAKEDSSIIFYFGKYREVGTGYIFDSNKMVRSIIQLNSSTNTVGEIEDFLKKKGHESISGTPYLRGADGKTKIAIVASEDGRAYYVNYLNYTNLFLEPFTTWYYSRDNVKARMATLGYKLLSESDNADDNYGLIYEGRRLDMWSAYFFNSKMTLMEVDMIFNPDLTPFDDVCSHLKTLGYLPMQNYKDVSDNSLLYQHPYSTDVAVVNRPSNLRNVVRVVFWSFSEFLTHVNNNPSTRSESNNGIVEFTDQIAPELLIGIKNKTESRLFRFEK